MQTIHKKQIKNIEFQRNKRFDTFYQNELDKACFQSNIAYDKYKDLTRRATPQKELRDEVCETASNQQIIHTPQVYQIF